MPCAVSLETDVEPNEVAALTLSGRQRHQRLGAAIALRDRAQRLNHPGLRLLGIDQR
jgi:hypothetical protein